MEIDEGKILCGSVARTVERGGWWLCVHSALTLNRNSYFFEGGYINQLILFICRLVFCRINNFTLVNKFDMTCPMGL